MFPLDVPSLEEARVWIERLASEVGVMKVGLELFTAEGPGAVRAVGDAGCACFLDLKLHDIPATMAGASASAARLGVRYLTVHASAGPKALEAVRRAVEGTETRVLAVTALTSLDARELAAIGWDDPKSVVRRLAALAVRAGIDGFVCSPHECADVRAIAGAGACIVVPGVRPAGTSAGDQARVATPTEAIRSGADLLVIGRPIRDAREPVDAARAIAREIEAA